MKNKKYRMIAILVAAVLLFALIFYIVWGNTALELNMYTVTGERLPEAFDGFRIVQISDLHNAEFGKNNEKLLSMIKEAKPNIIVITGDMIDSRHTNVDKALNFAEQAVQIAPCYYVPGNHEARIPKDYEVFIKSMNFVLLNSEKEIYKNKIDGVDVYMTYIEIPI